MAHLAQVCTLNVIYLLMYCLHELSPYLTAGKTMTANAVANYLKKKILLVTISLLLDKDITKVRNGDNPFPL